MWFYLKVIRSKVAVSKINLSFTYTFESVECLDVIDDFKVKYATWMLHLDANMHVDFLSSISNMSVILVSPRHNV